MPSGLALASDVIGGDLVWWRETGDLHTLVTLYLGPEDSGPATFDSVTLRFALFDPQGNLRKSWEHVLRKADWMLVDSRAYGDSAEEGVLAISVAPPRDASPEAVRAFHRLYSLVDWYSDSGDTVCLHSDQSFVRKAKPLEFTEIVFLETGDQPNFLVLMNGPVEQRAGSLALRMRNAEGQTRSAAYDRPMPPFSLHKLFLRDLVPDLARFCGGREATLEGSFDSLGIFARPYVITQSQRLGGYHGGDRYGFPALPAFAHRQLGRGEVNPMVAVHSPQVTTTVNLLNSHGDLEQDFWVDARLYDCAGTLVAERPRWLLARRHALSRGDIAALLPEAGSSFAGHIALNFSPHDGAHYPRRLQALLEYRSPVNAARVMAWSDIWNARDRIAKLRTSLAGVFPLELFYPGTLEVDPAVTLKCHQRAWCNGPIESYLAITNCGAADGYQESIEYRILFRNLAGEVRSYTGALPPQGTAFGPVESFLPGATAFVGPEMVALVSVESRADLAVMNLNRHKRSGAYSAEHFMADPVYKDGKYYWFCGA
ncbi:MAG: hypothetical protein ACRD3A_07365 [Terriglobales bacterium]